MKIERISDNQIKFTLTESDLSERNMHLHELSYGSEKAQELFREVMERAMVECDFHTNHETPLIIEAVPSSHNGIMVIVTKVNKSEELDQRFGYPPIFGHPAAGGIKPKLPKKVHPDMPPAGKKPLAKKTPPPKQIIFEFESLDNVILAATRLIGTRKGNNTLFKYKSKFYLAIDCNERRLTPAQENILKEYGNKFSGLEISKTFLLEHGEVILDGNAVAMLAINFGQNQ